eukprot:GHRQ01031567.1.p1 GENE.GHRQ01031567.1~~GHRQ01031567.1.p1  ORF type:complete len:258 (+),score=64.81 GHRQ01031567.1:276-1049(+)
MVHVVLGTSLVENPEVAEGGVLPLLHKKFAQPQDIFYINFGIWHKNLEQHVWSYRPALEALARFYKATKVRFPHVVFGETPAQHQRTGNGRQCAAAAGFRYNAASGLLTTTPAVNAALRSAGRAVPPKGAARAASSAAGTAAVLAANAAAAEQAAIVYQQAWDLGIVTNQLASEVLSRQGLPVLPFFNISVPLHDNHASVPLVSGKLDCMHYCHPGIPEMWVWYMYDFLRSPQGVQALPNQVNPSYTLPCRVMKSAQ